MFPGIFTNTILFSALLAWFAAQVLKVFLHLFLHGKLDLQLLFSSGGFPSSHSATVTALAFGIGKYYGWNSPIFAVAAVFAMIVMYDAAGVRRAAGKQAEVINQLVERLYQGSDPSQERLRELIGHSPLEVFGGALVGVIIGTIV
ncbi:Phosphatidic acid phosphatase type 2/haloperoxidase [Acididesulfobacillus acetoxydans]|uniref:Acid phosphatase/vanadium-dependent haloperoxidase related protein n=1 Tax=Acididesulfobacillus acetoxydans TaxID=1561005 RepID=A0A8S0Y3I8_9FIRM|nr:divergent PAP2 family protein [Acididesulfobacillus acetoxydans]CAA7602115.1 Phosphatidic acid phosphatase type 2/haloperoxidase [Acididesulfobacillus acetoxydans]CEJ08042.1 Acid phosphatase/vanadium-dependent haloperoxidase related protein [Acididesulfobacillus acetoxydans]